MYTIRMATVDDAALITMQRRLMFRDMGVTFTEAVESTLAEFERWVAPRLASGEYVGWFAIAADGTVAAGAGVWLMQWPPHTSGPGPRANILNVYTEQAHRRKGLARLLMNTALAWCRSENISTVILHASDEGRPLYEQLGFVPTNEMRLQIGQTSG
jgi:GNAT superfamily N-acetyltransferase